MKKLAWLSGLLFVSLLYVGCGSSKTDNTPQTLSCPQNMYYSNGQCYGAAGLVTNANFSYMNGFYADNHTGTTGIRIVDANKMKELFKVGMGLCDLAAHNYGQANCDSYLAGQLDIVIQFPSNGSNNMLATIIAQPQVNANFNYSAQLPSGWGVLGAALGYTTGVWLPDPTYYNAAYRNPLQLQMVLSAINNSAGFEARGYGDYWTGLNRTLLTIQVPNGKMQDSSFGFNFLIGGTTAAQGIMNRCQTLNCSL